MNVLTLHAQFKLPEEFVGDVPTALRELAAYLESAGAVTHKLEWPGFAECHAGSLRGVREAVVSGGRFFGAVRISSVQEQLSSAEVEAIESAPLPSPAMQIEVDVRPTVSA